MFDGIIRDAVALANQLTASLQPQVLHQRWIGQDVNVTPVYAAPVSRPALVERKQRVIRRRDGQEVLAESRITFLEPLEPIAPAVTGRTEPIDERDIFTLPDGTTGPILAVMGLIDPTTGRPYFPEVFLGGSTTE